MDKFQDASARLEQIKLHSQQSNRSGQDDLSGRPLGSADSASAHKPSRSVVPANW